MAGLPDLLTIEEAARVIRVGRTKAYAMAHEWRTTGGESGLPVIDFGHVLRVPLCQLETMVGGPLTDREPGVDEQRTAVEPQTSEAAVRLALRRAGPEAVREAASSVSAVPTLDPAHTPRATPRAPRRRSRTPDQPTLPFTS